MGSFSHNCKLSNLPITSGPATLIIMKPAGNMYDNSDEELKTYGKTYLCSNDGPRMKYIPVWLPIHGEYNTYGTIEDIIEDDNTRLLEKHYGLTIEQIVGIITSSRKDDGYDEDLKVIKKKGKDEYGKPRYEDRYKELLTYSGMWVKTAVYRKLAQDKQPDPYSQMDLGTPELLEALGFKETGKSKDGRYNRVFTKDKINVCSDGRWINIPNKHVYNLKQLKKYIEEKGGVLEIEPYNSWSTVEQYLRLKAKSEEEPLSEEEIEKALTESKEAETVTDEMRAKLKKALKSVRSLSSGDSTLMYYLLNGKYSGYGETNPMSKEYLRAVKDKRLIQDFVDFWNFDKYMYATGNFYEIVGTSPQDGDRKSVKKLLEVSLEVINQEMKEYGYDEEDEEEFED